METRSGPDGMRAMELLLFKMGFHIIPVSEVHANEWFRAFRLYGKGRHPAGLNYGDCFSYALAKLSGEPLPFKGNDFSQTDLACVPIAGA